MTAKRRPRRPPSASPNVTLPYLRQAQPGAFRCRAAIPPAGSMSSRAGESPNLRSSCWASRAYRCLRNKRPPTIPPCCPCCRAKQAARSAPGHRPWLNLQKTSILSCENEDSPRDCRVSRTGSPSRRARSSLSACRIRTTYALHQPTPLHQKMRRTTFPHHYRRRNALIAGEGHLCRPTEDPPRPYVRHSSRVACTDPAAPWQNASVGRRSRSMRHATSWSTMWRRTAARSRSIG